MNATLKSDEELLDQFATVALQAIIAKLGTAPEDGWYYPDDMERAAEKAYTFARLMLEERRRVLTGGV